MNSYGTFADALKRPVHLAGSQINAIMGRVAERGSLGLTNGVTTPMGFKESALGCSKS